MRKLIFILFLMAVSGYAHADWTQYLVEKPDGSVAIVGYNTKSKNDSLKDVIDSLGYTGYPISLIRASELPSRSDREFWKKNDVPIGDKVIIDEVKKAQKEAEKASEKTARDAVLTKLKITEEEFKKIKDIK